MNHIPNPQPRLMKVDHSKVRSKIRDRIQNRLWFKTLSIVLLTSGVVVFALLSSGEQTVSTRRLEGGCTKADPAGLAVLYALGVLYCFVALAILADELFVPALEKISDQLGLSEDVAGATLMAAGGSAPELFTSAVATFMGSSAGFGAIVGSAVFNVLFVVGICAILTPGAMQLTPWPLCRDSAYYIVVLIVLAIFFGVTSAGVIEWWEALIIHLLYYCYVFMMSQNEKLRNYFTPKAKVAPSLKNDIEMKAVSLPDPILVNQPTKDVALFRRPSKFRQGIHRIMVSPKLMQDTIGTEMVTRMVGDVDSVFASIDKNGNGTIDKIELKELFALLGVPATEFDLQTTINQIDTNKSGIIEKTEFTLWFTTSKERFISLISKYFEQHDTDKSGSLDANEIFALLVEISGGQKYSPEEYTRFISEINPTNKQKVTKGEFEKWFFDSQIAKQCESIAKEEAEEIEGISLSPPEGGFTKGMIWYLITIPIIFCYYWTVPNTQIPRKYSWQAKSAPYLAFVLCLAWMGFFSFFMVSWTETIGATAGIPTVIMGLTFLACGTSVPDMLSARKTYPPLAIPLHAFLSVIVAKKGQGDQAVSSSVGSNIFDICVGLGFPWCLYMLIYQGSVTVAADNLVISLVTIAACMATVITLVSCRGWMLDKYSGYFLVFMYFCFVGEQLGLVKSWGGGC